MKTLPTGMQAHLDSGCTTLCWCWKVTLGNTTVLGFTDHDVDVPFGGVTYEAATGFTASEIATSLEMSVDNLTASGMLNSDAITEADISAGLYDKAEVEIWRVNWATPAQRVLMRKGWIGEVSRGKSAYQATLVGLMSALNEEVGRAFNVPCDADVGDSRCKIDLTLAAYKGTGTVTEVLDLTRIKASGLGSFATDWFSSGKLTWTSGANNGHSIEVKRHGITSTIATVEMWQDMSEAVEVGDTFTITAGCNKLFKTCKEKYNNVNNHRGFPYMPGNDTIISYPTKDSVMDGGSRYGN